MLSKQLPIILVVGVLAITAWVSFRAATQTGLSYGSEYAQPFPPANWDEQETALEVSADPSVPAGTTWDAVQKAIASGQRPVDMLMLPTGRVIISDLNFIDGSQPLRRKVPAGRYPVYDFDDGISGWAAVVLQPDQPVERWLVADAYGETAAQLAAPQGLWGVGLDSSPIFVDAIVRHKQSTYDAGPMIERGWASVVVDQETGANAVCVQGGGVGLSKPYWGLDANGEACVLLLLNP